MSKADFELDLLGGGLNGSKFKRHFGWWDKSPWPILHPPPIRYLPHTTLIKLNINSRWQWVYPRIPRSRVRANDTVRIRLHRRLVPPVSSDLIPQHAVNRMGIKLHWRNARNKEFCWYGCIGRTRCFPMWQEFSAVSYSSGR